MAQIVREHQHSDDTEVRPMQLTVVGEELVAVVDAFDPAENFDTQLQSTLLVRKMGGGNPALAAAADARPPALFRQIAPGRYEARARLGELGAFTVRAEHKRRLADGTMGSAGVSYGSATRPYPEEFLDLVPRPSALAGWAQAGAGSMAAPPGRLFAPGQDRVTSRVGRQNETLYLAIVLFLLDLLLRRVRLFDRDFRRSA
jgi:hypothetical protein